MEPGDEGLAARYQGWSKDIIQRIEKWWETSLGGGVLVVLHCFFPFGEDDVVHEHIGSKGLKQQKNKCFINTNILDFLGPVN